MQIYPAIDIKRGKTAYSPASGSSDPIAAAEQFLEQGATWLHVVDMDRAFETGEDNTEQVRQIARLRGATVQLGGLLGTVEQVQHGVEAGAARVIAATSVLLDAALLDALQREAGRSELGVAIDVREGQPVLRGTGEPLRESAAELAERAHRAGIRTLVYRDIDRDGRLSGFDADGAATLRPFGDVIVSGGGASLDDVGSARRSGVAGAIVGRALYDGRFTLREAIACSQ